MRTLPAVLLTLLLFSIFAFSQAPVPATQPVSSPDYRDQPLKLGADFSQVSPESVHLAGVAHVTAGSTEESGTFSFDVKKDGESSLRLNAGELSRTDSASGFGENPECTWSGSDGVQHKAANHNCWLSLDWVLPGFALQQRRSSLDKLLLSRSEAAEERVELTRTVISAGGSTQELLRKVSAVTLALEPSTGLPTSLSFNLHPDIDANTDIPIVVRYSDYRQVNGASIPFHIEKYLNNSLVLDLSVESAVIQ